MDHQAHGLDLEHAIFNTPNKVSFSWTETPRESQYEGATSVLYPKGMAETFRLTPFEHDKADGWNPILVDHEGFFTDIPGFESIAEGHSAKCLGSLSLARQGRWFYWGYSIDPERMTDAAKDTLVNVLHYMRVKRDSITVPFVCKTRHIFHVYLDLNRRTGYKRGIEEHMPGSLTPAWRETYTDRTPAGYEAWLDRHLPYVFSGKAPEHRSERYPTVFEVDADAMALGTPNDAVASLEAWIGLSKKEGAEGDRARRLLTRYVHPSVAPKDSSWDAWYEKQKDRIAFIESTGFWWQESPLVLERERANEGR
jgi:hypothetical protein